MTGTPRTDARGDEGVSADFARQLERENTLLRIALFDIHLKAHCLAKAGPLHTPTLSDAWSHFMQIGAMATDALWETRTPKP